MSIKLKKDFYNRNVLIVAEELLGKVFVNNDKLTGKTLKGRIVEVEAYDGRNDQAAHTFRGETERNKVMFEEGGFLYVYFTYGIHFCANVVADKKGIGAAVLLRAMEPVSGDEIFAKRRFNKTDLTEKQRINLLNGPAKICQAFGLDRKDNGKKLFSEEVYILNGVKPNSSEIIKGKRIGINKSVDLPWRFYLKDNPYVSGFVKNKKVRK